MDALKATYDALRSELTNRGIKVITGYRDEENRLPVIHVEGIDSEEPWTPFLEAVLAVDARFVVMDSGLLEEVELVAALERAEEDADGVEEDRQAVISQLKKCRAAIGHTAILTASVYTGSPAMEFRYQCMADWYDAVYDTDSALAGGDDNEDDDHESIGPREIKELARQVAADPRFIAARNDSAREYVARETLGDRADGLRWQFDEVVTTAKSIVDVEVKPKIEEENRKMARQLAEQRVPRGEIAERLNVSKATVSRWIA